MVSDEDGGGGRRSSQGTSSGLVGRAFRFAARTVFGIQPAPVRRAKPLDEPPQDAGDVEPETIVEVDEPAEDVADEPASVEDDEEMVTPHPSDSGQPLSDIARRLEYAIDRYNTETRRLSDETARIALVADRLEARLNELNRMIDGNGVALPAAPEASEPRFQPNDTGVDLVISAVPGFQELMDAQRALSSLPGVSGASVHRFQNGQAALEVALRSPIAAREVVDGLRAATGLELAIEEVRPEASRLRLRFTGALDA